VVVEKEKPSRPIKPSKLVSGGLGGMDGTTIGSDTPGNDGSVGQVGTPDNGGQGIIDSETGLDPRYKPHEVREVAEWVKPEHRAPFLLCVSLYSKPVRFAYDYSYQPTMSSTRVGVWQNSAGNYFVGLRGTTFLKKGSDLDLLDDVQIAFSKSSSMDISLVDEGDKVIRMLKQRSAKYIMVGGHSLGGFSAISLGTRYGLNTCSFNGAAPATFPVMVGPGRSLATHYHIVGDLVSTHMGCQAADVIRVDKKESFGFFTPHSTDRFYAKDPTTRLVDATAEDVALCTWAATNPPDHPSAVFITSMVYQHPIPCSARSKAGGEYVAAVILGQLACVAVVSGGKILLYKLQAWLAAQESGTVAAPLAPEYIQMLTMGEAEALGAGAEAGAAEAGAAEAAAVEAGAADAGAAEAGAAEAAVIGEEAATAAEFFVEFFEIGLEMLAFLL
jgi:hypothetical protein